MVCLTCCSLPGPSIVGKQYPRDLSRAAAHMPMLGNVRSLKLGSSSDDQNVKECPKGCLLCPAQCLETLEHPSRWSHQALLHPVHHPTRPCHSACLSSTCSHIHGSAGLCARLWKNHVLVVGKGDSANSEKPPVAHPAHPAGTQEVMKSPLVGSWLSTSLFGLFSHTQCHVQNTHFQFCLLKCFYTKYKF